MPDNILLDKVANDIATWLRVYADESWKSDHPSLRLLAERLILDLVSSGVIHNIASSNCELEAERDYWKQRAEAAEASLEQLKVVISLMILSHYPLF